MATPILEINNLHAFYGSSHVLQGVSITLEEQMTTIVGRNGMGKSTLINTIMGIVPAANGSILFRGEDITNKPPHYIAKRGIGYVPQGRRIFGSLTVDEQLRFAACNDKQEGSWNAERVYDFFPRLKERYKAYGNNLSGGEQQMLSIGRALVTNPKLLIMDEPSEGLAPIIVEQLIGFFSKLRETDLHILLVEQNMYFAMSVSETANIMMTGNFVYHDSYKKLLADKELSGRFLGVGV